MAAHRVAPQRLVCLRRAVWQTLELVYFVITAVADVRLQAATHGAAASNRGAGRTHASLLDHRLVSDAALLGARRDTARPSAGKDHCGNVEPELNLCEARAWLARAALGGHTAAGCRPARNTRATHQERQGKLL